MEEPPIATDSNIADYSVSRTHRIYLYEDGEVECTTTYITIGTLFAY